MRRGLAILAAGAGLAAIVVLFVLPAEFGIDPTGIGERSGLTGIADPPNPERERGLARMEAQDVLALSEAPLPPEPGVADVWEYELGPFEAVEFKYTIAEGQPITFGWQASAPLAYDMHAHPFDGGEDLTESYGIDEARDMQGRYTPAFSGIHGWFWENRSLETVTLRLEASGALAGSTVFSSTGAQDRPLEGAAEPVSGAVAGHSMQAGE